VDPAAEYESPEQSSHVPEPAAVETLPASHSSHEVWPVAPCAEPAGHDVQAVDAALVAYDPAPHRVHAVRPAEALADPARQSSHEAALAALILPASQSTQLELPEADAERFPAAHDTHPAAPVSVENVPSGQVVHAEDPAVE